MSGKLRDTGFPGDDIGSHGCRLTCTASNGNAVAVIRDTNSVGTPGGDGTGVEKLYIYESTVADRNVWNLRATLSLPVSIYRIAMTLYANNDISIWIMSNPRTTIRHTRVTYGTWAIATAWETVATAGANESWNRFDVHTTDDGWAMVAATWFNSVTAAHGFRAYLKPTAGGAWSTPANVQIGADGYNEPFSAISLTSSIVNTVAGANHRQIHYAVAAGKTVTDSNLGDSDLGTQLYNQWIHQTTFAPNAVPSATGAAIGAVNGEGGSPDFNNLIGSREVKLFKYDSKIWLGINQNVFSRDNLWAMRYTTSSSGLVLEGSISSNTGVDKTYNIILPPKDLSLGIAFANGAFNFMWGQLSTDGSNYVPVNRVARLNGAVFEWSPTTHYWDTGVQDPAGSMALNLIFFCSTGDKNTELHRIDVMELTKSTFSGNNLYQWRCQPNIIPETIRESDKSPQAGAVLNSSNPVFSGYLQHSSFYTQSRGVLQVQAARDAAFTTSIKDFVSTIFAPYGRPSVGSPSYNKLSVTTPDALYLQSGSAPWYYHERVQDEWGYSTAWTAGSSFTVSHPSNAIQQIPLSGAYIDYSTGSVYTEWRISDAWAPDWQTAFQVQIIRTDTSAVVHDSGKITSGNQFYSTPALSATLKTVPLAWRVQVWDSGDQTAGYTSYRNFLLLDGPTITVTSPASGATVVTPNPTITFSVSTYSAVPVVSLSVTVYQNGVQVWSSGVIPPPGSTASGTTYNIPMAGNLLHNGQNYSVQVSATDQWGITTSSALVTFTAAWTPPAAPTGVSGVTTQYNVEGDGYVRVLWTSATRDAQFNYYSVERQDSLYDPDTAAVLEVGTWNEVYKTYDKSQTNYEFQDYYAPSGYRVSYRVTQVVTRFNDLVPSNPSTVVDTFPYSESYWLIDPSLGVDDRAAFRLYNVTGDSFTDAYEEAEYTVIGRGFHVDQGERLGYTGSLTAQLRTGGGTTARYKRLRLENIKKNASNLYLRNPFGDVFKVAVKSMQLDRIPGVGRSEFIDVSIPYSQVGE